jgi:hypothetical protein
MRRPYDPSSRTARMGEFFLGFIFLAFAASVTQREELGSANVRFGVTMLLMYLAFKLGQQTEKDKTSSK